MTRSVTSPMMYLGIDGEGQGRKPHRYTLLACASADLSYRRCVENEKGLTTRVCLDFILSLPVKGTMISAFAFGYDLTKILADVPDGTLYELFRSELRNQAGPMASRGPQAVQYDPRPYSPMNDYDPDVIYHLNLIGSKFTVQRGKVKVVVWDTFKFYGTKFVASCALWKVGTKEERDQMQLMKDERHRFDQLSPDDVRDYCFKECSFMAQLSRKLVSAHADAEIPLTTFYGAGSSAGGILKKLGTKEKRRDPSPAMAYAVACAFSGGRFEHSAIGAIREPVTNWDISSAYPYQITFLPCLEHGVWRLTRSRKRAHDAKAALIHYGLGKVPPEGSLSRPRAWGPFPYRISEGNQAGSICYPIESAGGWVWRDEYLAGERVFSHVEFREAWVFESECECRPFDAIPGWYLERLAIGKEGPGIVIKLALNSLYGKMAQSVGNAQYQCWIWASMITSGCRAQALDLLGLHDDPSDMLMVATDGVRTRDPKLACDKGGVPLFTFPPRPRETGTDHDVMDRTTGKTSRKPLGGWEGKYEARGVFLARPGVYFPLNPTEEDMQEIKARGLGRGFLFKNWRHIVKTYERGDSEGRRGVHAIVSVDNLERFCGAKTSISLGIAGSTVHRRAAGGKKQHEDGTWHDAPSYGEWVHRRVELKFHPAPKRDGIEPDGVSLTLRRFPRDGKESAPYTRTILSPEALELQQAEMEALEQPDVDLSEIGGFDEGGM